MHKERNKTGPKSFCFVVVNGAVAEFCLEAAGDLGNGVLKTIVKWAPHRYRESRIGTDGKLLGRSH